MKLTEKTGWHPKYSLERGLFELVNENKAFSPRTLENFTHNIRKICKSTAA